MSSDNIKYTFSGHDSFQCRHFWLKKGYDYVKAGKSFNSEDAVVELGVGKNMVSAIRYWMKAFDMLTTNDKLTVLAEKLLDDNGWDPYLEDEASLWLLHYHLVKRNFASTYSIIFNELRKEKVEFTKENFLTFTERKSKIESFQINKNTLSEDFSVFIKMYLRTDEQGKDKEEGSTGILTDLNLVKKIPKRITNDERKEQLIDFYYIDSTERTEIPDEIILYAILDKGDFDASVNLNNIETNQNSAGIVFPINRSGLLTKIENLTQKFSYIIYNDQAGVKELQFKQKPDAMSILEQYYAN